MNFCLLNAYNPILLKKWHNVNVVIKWLISIELLNNVTLYSIHYLLNIQTRERWIFNSSQYHFIPFFFYSIYSIPFSSFIKLPNIMLKLLGFTRIALPYSFWKSGIRFMEGWYGSQIYFPTLWEREREMSIWS